MFPNWGRLFRTFVPLDVPGGTVEQPAVTLIHFLGEQTHHET